MTIYRKILNATTHQLIFSHYLNRNKKFKNNQFHKDFNNNDDLCIQYVCGGGQVRTNIGTYIISIYNYNINIIAIHTFIQIHI